MTTTEHLAIAESLHAEPRRTASMMIDGDHIYTAVSDESGEVIARFVHKTEHAKDAATFVKAHEQRTRR